MQEYDFQPVHQFSLFSILSLAEATIILFFAPLITTILAPLILKEKSHYHTLLAVMAGFIGMIIVRNIGDQIFTTDNNSYIIWTTLIGYLKTLATVFLTMAMAAVGISINLSELKSMGYKPFVVGLIAAITVGFISLIYIETLIKFI